MIGGVTIRSKCISGVAIVWQVNQWSSNDGKIIIGVTIDRKGWWCYGNVASAYNICVSKFLKYTVQYYMTMFSPKAVSEATPSVLLENKPDRMC